ncbi:CYTH domain-containing protein [Conexibacter sp. SYSU D00693]|uniref:CYTH domain-containing protein n=1 Tax=Conexibacter sp. SYSU D00693 TaxID=2812560 RepID=UPI00196ACE01|nr:CYTH domain-containing protein [Conexibacter sp. SYSU D00693]
MADAAGGAAPVEVERKFLVVGEVPGLGTGGSSAIRQGYVAVAATGDEVRVRERDGACVLTVKHGGAGLVRGEAELPVSADLFAELWAQTEGRRVEKVRHLVPLDGGLVAEVDVFGGALEGLVLAEVEFGSVEEARAFVAPPWLGRDVTDDAAYRNQRLALGRPPG